jgi:urea carboxylase
VEEARHIEVQVFGNGKGKVGALGTRDCSLQRRNQKVIEETPPPGIAAPMLTAMCDAATRLCESIAYESAGTVEFIYDSARNAFYFLEVNTRLQVEHPVTEMVTGLDLVDMMIRQAAGEDVLSSLSMSPPSGAAIEARIYAENPNAGFRPTAGTLTHVSFPDSVRVDGWVETGTEVTTNYDPMLAKLIVHGESRNDAIAKLALALDATDIAGIETNLGYLRAIVSDQNFETGQVATHLLSNFLPAQDTIDVISPGVQTSLQELPGRLGYWQVGVPPSGPMDMRSFRLANRMVGNPDDVAALEITMRGPELRFNCDAVITLAGAAIEATLDGLVVPMHMPVSVKAKQVLSLGNMPTSGRRSYLALQRSFHAPEHLGSRAAFMLGGFGGHATGALKAGDVLRRGNVEAIHAARVAFPDEVSHIPREWTIGVVYGPQGAPDFFRESAIETLFSAPYDVHFNSDRTGVRLIGPKPDWARDDGGEAGLHPSNLHDNAYAVGAIDFTGDMPIILGPDGPSLGGFCCPAVVTKDDLWMIGQLRPGDKVRFAPVARFYDPVGGPTLISRPVDIGSPVLARREGDETTAVYRRQGDNNLIVEFGPMQLNIPLRMRVQALYEALLAENITGIIDLTPGIRSLQVHYDDMVLPRRKLLDLLMKLEAALGSMRDFSTPSRIVHLPLSWKDPDVLLAMRKYQELTYPDAPWCPDNVEFIRRINGLPDEAAVKQMIFDASYLVLGLGDVYLGAPVATPIEPRHRLVTTKYNPARIWTPENAVGIGGAYLCVYGMEGPGGYQLFGRTIQMWNRWRTTPEFQEGTPWLLRFFDQIKFYEVDAAELKEARAAFPHGRYPVKIEDTVFSAAGYDALLKVHAEENAAFVQSRETAFTAERKRWETIPPPPVASSEPSVALDVPDGFVGCFTEVPGTVWKLVAELGSLVAQGATLLIVESMKTEFQISAPKAGRLTAIFAKRGQSLNAGDLIGLIQPV